MVLTAMARCDNAIRNYDEALELCSKVRTRSRLTGRTPAPEVFLISSHIYMDVEKAPGQAIDALSSGLLYYGTTPIGGKMHLRLANIFGDLKWSGLAFSGLCCAALLEPENQQIRRDLATYRTRMSLDDIVQLNNKFHFDEELISFMVRHTPLSFSKTEAELVKMCEAGTMTVPLAKAILKSNEQYPPNGGGGVVPRGNVPRGNAPANNNGHPTALVGTWSAKVRGQRNSGTVVMTLEAGGDFMLSVEPDGAAAVRGGGQWVADQSHIVFSPTGEDSQTDSYAFTGDSLIVDVSKLGRLQFKRQ
jgi:hypothetical protein